jgi:protein-tyrosine phosphatase
LLSRFSKREEVNEVDLQNKEMFCNESCLNFLSLPISDRQTPHSVQETKFFVELSRNLLRRNEKIAIHCRQGMGVFFVNCGLLFGVGERDC